MPRRGTAREVTPAPPPILTGGAVLGVRDRRRPGRDAPCVSFRDSTVTAGLRGPLSDLGTPWTKPLPPGACAAQVASRHGVASLHRLIRRALQVLVETLVRGTLAHTFFVPEANTNDEEGQIATGYPIARDRILIARPPLFPGPPGRYPDRLIEVRWRCRGVAPDWLPVSG